MKLKKLKAISYWFRKLSNQGNDDPDINTLDNVTLHDLVVEMNAKEERDSRLKGRVFRTLLSTSGAREETTNCQ